VGSVQGDAFASHRHEFRVGGNTGGGNFAHEAGTNTKADFTEFTGSNETRPQNANVEYIIKV
jgi:hypothetical protein